MRKTLIAPVAALLLLLATVGLAWAWDPTLTSAPSSGNFWLSSGTNQVATADYVQWSSSALTAMRSDSNPRLDVTADCTVDNPGDDQLNYAAAYTNIPNSGIDVWDDCGVFWVREEVEVKINASSVAANTNYYYQVHYSKNETGVSGAINITYQRGTDYDWLDKVTYSQ